MYYPKCHDRRENCFARNEDGRCVCLKEAKFGGECPFYKPAEELDIRDIEDCIRDYEMTHKGAQE